MKSTKKSLFLSILSLMLCVTMLVGTTFAWFTDSVTSGKNRIVAGNLDIEVYHTNKTETDEKIDAQTDLFKDVALWEPGAVAYENFTVKNVGTLAAKYKFNLNVADKNSLNNHDLTEVIKVSVIPNAVDEDVRADLLSQLTFVPLADFQKNGSLDANTGSDTYGVVLYWEPTDNDNLYNVNNGQSVSTSEQGITAANAGNALFVDFGITVTATQDTVESDSFDNQYDALAGRQILTGVDTQKVVAGSQSTFTVDGAPAGATYTTTVTFEADAVEAGTKELTTVATEILAANTNANYQVFAEKNTVAAIELTLVDQNGNKVTDFSGKKATVTTHIAQGLTNVSLKYLGTGEEPTLVSYDAETGELVFTTTHFSKFAVGADQNSYIAQNNTAYDTLEDAVTYADGKACTITLLKDVDLTDYSASGVNAEYTADLTNDTLDLNGYKITSKNHAVDYMGDNVIIQNGTFEVTESGSYGLCLSHATATLKNIATVGGINAHASTVEVYNGTCNETKGTNYYALWADFYTTITVYSGKFSSPSTCGGCVLNASNTGNSGHGKIIVKGGEFEALGTAEIFTNTDGTIVVEGGTFNKNVSAVTSYPYAVTDNQDGTFTVNNTATHKVTWSAEEYVSIANKTNLDAAIAEDPSNVYLDPHGLNSGNASTKIVYTSTEVACYGENPEGIYNAYNMMWTSAACASMWFTKSTVTHVEYFTTLADAEACAAQHIGAVVAEMN